MPRYWRVFLLCILVVSLGSMDSGMVPIILDRIEQSFPATPLTTLSWVITAYTIALAALVVTSGRLSDRTGRRRMFLLGGWTFIAGALLSAAAPNPYVLIAARLVQGTGHALYTPASLGLILTAWPDERRTHALGAWVAAGGVAAAVGPVVGGAITQLADWAALDDPWRGAFLLHVAVGVPALIASHRALPDTQRVADTKLPDLLSIVFLTIMLASTTLVMVEARSWGWSDARIVGFAIAAVVFGAAFAARSRVVDTPVLDFALLRPRAYRISLVVSFVLALSVFANLVMQAQFLQKVWHYDVFGAGLAVIPLPAAAAIASPVAARLADRYGHKPLILGGISLSAIGLFWFTFMLDTTPHYWTAFFPATVMVGGGTWGCAIAMINGAAAATLTTENFGVGLAILQTLRQVGSIMGGALFFGLYGTPLAGDVFDTFHRIWLLFAFMPLVALAIATRLPGGGPSRRDRRRLARADQLVGGASSS